MSKPSRHSFAVRHLLRWVDSNEFPWTLPLPPWYPRRTRALRRLRRLARRDLRAQHLALHGWPRTLTQSLVWPGMALLKAVLSLSHYPADPGESSGPLLRLRAVALRWWFQIAHNLCIADQFETFLHLPANRSRPTAFIACRESQALLGNAKNLTHGFADINDKNGFARFCSENNLPTPVVCLAGRGASVLSARSLPPADLFLKLANSGKGDRAETLRHDPASATWLGTDGTRSTETELPAYVARRLGDEEWIIQERLQNAPSWRGYTPGALATVRIVTARYPSTGELCCLVAYLRMPCKNPDVDNMSAGGIGAHIDPASGRLEPGLSWSDIGIRYDRHPGTGGPIAGTLLPGWDEIRALALRAHAAAGPWLSLGWDIALTARGPVLVETNLSWAMVQLIPVLDTAYTEVLSDLYFPPRR